MYEVKTAAEVLRILGTDKDKGLKRREAMERKTKYGANKLKDQEQKSLGQMILEQLNDPLILILVVAMAISLMLHELGDAIIIITVVALNATVGIIQEGKAGKAVEALKKISSPQAVVLREGERMRIPAEDLVQGDILFAHLIPPAPQHFQRMLSKRHSLLIIVSEAHSDAVAADGSPVLLQIVQQEADGFLRGALPAPADAGGKDLPLFQGDHRTDA